MLIRSHYVQIIFPANCCSLSSATAVWTRGVCFAFILWFWNFHLTSTPLSNNFGQFQNLIMKVSRQFSRWAFGKEPQYLYLLLLCVLEKPRKVLHKWSPTVLFNCSKGGFHKLTAERLGFQKSPESRQQFSFLLL